MKASSAVWEDKIRQFFTTFYAEHGHYPLHQDVADNMGVSVQWISRVIHRLVESGAIQECAICSKKLKKDGTRKFRNMIYCYTKNHA